MVVPPTPTVKLPSMSAGPVTSNSPNTVAPTPEVANLAVLVYLRKTPAHCVKTALVSLKFALPITT